MLLVLLGASAQAGDETPLPQVPGVEIRCGLAGLSQRGVARPVTIDVTGGPDGLSEEIELRSGGLRHVIGVSAAPGGRRRLRLTVPPYESGERWSVGNREIQVPGARPANGATGIEITREGGTILQGLGSLGAVATMPPEDAPIDPEDWQSADLVLVDADVAAELDDRQWRALADRALTGMTLVVHGSFLDAVPPEYLATNERSVGRIEASEGALPVTWLRAGGGERTPGLSLLEDPALTRVRSSGLGTLVTVGVDLPLAWEHGLLDLGELSASRQLDPTRAAAPQPHFTWKRIGHAPTARESRVLFGLGGALLVLFVGHGLAGRRTPRSDAAVRRTDWRLPALGVGLGAVLFLLGFERPAAEGTEPDLVYEEYFPDAQRRRVTRYRPLEATEGRAALPRGSGRLTWSNAFHRELVTIGSASGRVELAPRPATTDLRPSLTWSPWWTTVSWEDASEAPLRVELGPSGAPRLVGPAAQLPGRALRTGSAQGLALLEAPAQPKSRLPPLLATPSERELLVRITGAALADVAVACDTLNAAGEQRVVVVHRPQGLAEPSR